MDETKRLKIDADEASRILDSDLVKRFFTVARTQVIERITEVASGDSDEIKELALLLKNIDAFKSFLTSYMRHGEVIFEREQRDEKRNEIERKFGKRGRRLTER